MAEIGQLFKAVVQYLVETLHKQLLNSHDANDIFKLSVFFYEMASNTETDLSKVI